MNQARSEEEEKERQDSLRKAAQQNKNTSEELKQGIPRHSSQKYLRSRAFFLL